MPAPARRAVLVLSLTCALLSMAGPAHAADAEAKPIALHPDNPHYFLFRGKPTVLVASGEHYGSVLNVDFDFVKYLDELKAKDLNLTRTFSGYYREVPGSFGIRGNTLAPAEGKYSSPWAQVGEGKDAKYDLTRWNEDHFRRMRSFVAEAGQRGVVVEMSLFCPFYEDVLWDIDPLNPKHNVNHVGENVKDRKEVNTLQHTDIVQVQEALARKVVRELKDYDNVYFEICNEPYFGGALDWQAHIASVITEAEKELPHKHLIAQNIANGSSKIADPNPTVSIFNFHYCNPPEAVGQNWGLDKAIAYDETGFKGSGDDVYRIHGWQFLLAGGAVYDNLDYSFTTSNAGGTAESSAPGGGSPALREQLRTLKHFVTGFDFVHMKPDRQAAKANPAAGVAVYALVEPGKQYAVYVTRGEPEKKNDHETGNFTDPAAGKPVRLKLDLPAGSYRTDWLDPTSGKARSGTELKHAGGEATLESPAFTVDIALRILSAQ